MVRGVALKAYGICDKLRALMCMLGGQMADKK
jgi:hypothetical protein